MSEPLKLWPIFLGFRFQRFLEQICIHLAQTLHDFTDFNHVPASLHLSYYSVQTKDIWWFETFWKHFLSCPAKMKIEGSIVLSRKKLCVWYLRLSQKMRSYKVYHYRRHKNGKHLDLLETGIQIPTFTLTLKRFLLLAPTVLKEECYPFPSFVCSEGNHCQRKKLYFTKYFVFIFHLDGADFFNKFYGLFFM